MSSDRIIVASCGVRIMLPTNLLDCMNLANEQRMKQSDDEGEQLNHLMIVGMAGGTGQFRRPSANHMNARSFEVVFVESAHTLFKFTSEKCA